jgi:hypothetical protein
MRPILFAMAAALSVAAAAPAFADTMQRDGGHSGRLGDSDVLYPAPYGQIYTGRSVAVPQHRLRNFESYHALDGAAQTR